MVGETPTRRNMVREDTNHGGGMVGETPTLGDTHEDGS